MTSQDPTDLELEATLSTYAEALNHSIPATSIPSADPDHDSGSAPLLATELGGASYGSSDPSPPATRSSRLAVAAALLAFGVIAVALVVGRGATGPSSGTPGWSRLSKAPIAGRSETTVIWTGSQFIVFGGRDPLLDPAVASGRTVGTSAPPGSPAASSRSPERPLDGAAYDPASRRWTTVPEPPVPAGFDVIPIATASDTLTVMYGPVGCSAAVGAVTSAGPSGATFVPSTGTWQPLPALPQRFTCNPQGVRVGDTLYVWGGIADGHTLGYALGPSGAWSRVPVPPMGRTPDLVASGGKVYAFSSGIGAPVSEPGETGSPAKAAVFDPGSSTWSALPDPPIVLIGGAVDLNGTVLVWDGQHGAVLTSLSTWHTTPDLPLAARVSAATAPVGGRFAVWGGWQVAAGGVQGAGSFQPFTQMLSDGALYDPATDAWQLMPGAPIGRRSGTGSAGSADLLFIWGGTNTDQSSVPQLDDGATYRPSP